MTAIANPVLPIEAFQASELLHRKELQKKDMEIIRLRDQVLGLGGVPVTASGEEFLEMYRKCTAVIRAAHECLVNLGSSKELLEDAWV